MSATESLEGASSDRTRKTEKEVTVGTRLSSEELAAFVADFPYESIPEGVLRESRRHVLDTLGVSVGASRTSAVEILLDVTREFGGSPQASVPGLPFRCPVHDAARLFGTMSHVLDFDDTHIPTVLHPSGPALAAALPLAEWLGASGRDLLSAFVFGVEAGCRTALALGPAHREAGWHVTGTAGPVAAAAACSRLLGLDASKTHNALSIAATEAAGHHAQAGTMTKPLHSGNAASNGVMAAMLAGKGYVASREGFEGLRGLLNVTSSRPAPEELSTGLGERWEIFRVGFKPYPCGVVMHPAIDVMRSLARIAGAPADEVERIELRVHPLVMQLTDRRNPRTGMEGKFSITFASAICWIEGTARYEQFTDEKVNRPDVIALHDRVHVAADRNLSQTEAKAKIYLRGGDVVSEHVRHASGTPENPITGDDLRQKFYELVEPELGRAAARQIPDCIGGLENIDDLRLFLGMLTPPAGNPEASGDDPGNHLENVETVRRV